jgi:hypothetical protein
MMISTTADQEPGILRCLADKYGHPHWERRLDNCSGGPDRVSAGPRADKYGHVSENTSRQQVPDSQLASRRKRQDQNLDDKHP